MKTKIILVADVKGWAFDSIAQYLKDILSKKYDITILYSGEFKTPISLVEHIAKIAEGNMVHFFYRAYLQLAIDSCKNNKISKSDLAKFFACAISFGVPEHLFLETQKDISANNETFQYADNYYCTSSKLQRIYNKIDEYPKPHKEVIFDNVQFKDIKPNFDTNERLAVAWVGNSKWGLWYFDKNYDAKGYHSVAVPFFDALDENKIPHQKLIADSAQDKKDKQEVFQMLQQADILIITGKTDGTPLPIIEAMACGCAIITTDNGIAMDVLPEEQRQFIIAGEPDKFYHSFMQLNQNRERLDEIKKANYNAFKQLFLDQEFFFKKWDGFIQETLQRASKNQEKKQKFQQTIIERFNGSRLHSNLLFNIKNSSKIKSFVKSLLKIPLLGRGIEYLLYKLRPLNTEHLKKKLTKIKGDYIALYLEHYPGVRNSTVTLFENSVVLDFHYIFNHIAAPESELHKIASVIISSGKRQIIFSGANDNILKLMEICSQLKKANQQIDFIWHGSPAQWPSEYHLKQSIKLFDFYKNGVIANIATLKPDLEIALGQYNVKSYLLQNFIQNRVKQPKCNKKDISSLKIGLWSAYNSWIKNLYPQLLSASLAGKNVSLITNFNYDKYPCHIFDNIKATRLASELPHAELLANMSKTDITLYVTHSECSPMIALESLSLGVPCIVSATSKLYHLSPYLEKMLTVTRVDCSVAIGERIADVSNNLAEIQAALPGFIKQYNARADKLKKEFLKC